MSISRTLRGNFSLGNLPCFSRRHLTTGAFAPTIPVIDMGDYAHRRSFFVKGLQEAFRKIGFVGITNTGVQPSLLKNVYGLSRQFFNRSQQEKEQISGRAIGGERGYTGSSESPVGRAINVKDAKEFMHVGRELDAVDQARLGYPQNKWPSGLNLKDPVMELYRNLSDVAVPLATGIEEAIGAPLGTLHSKIQEGDHLLRLVRYPGDLKKGVEGAAAHIDSNFYTILPPATERGLEVSIQGEWIPVIVPSNAVIVNVGSMLEHMTNGYFHSALHRVVKYEEGGDDRYSLAYFVHTRENDAMTPLASCIERTGGVQKYPEATRQYLLYQRLFAMGRTTPMMEHRFHQWGNIKRWEGYFSPNDARVELVAEVEKVKQIMALKKSDV